jgi:6,7-dimethyl-8-ribityllumazine synthase
MATSNLSHYNEEGVPNGAPFSIALVVSEWNDDITGNLLKGAKETLLKHGVLEENIRTIWVPGSYELPLVAQNILEANKADGIVCLGSVIQGETKHFDFVCQSAADGIMNVGLKYNKPVIFGVLTDNTRQQGLDRSGGKLGNKGVECAVACLKMLAIRASL